MNLYTSTCKHRNAFSVWSTNKCTWLYMYYSERWSKLLRRELTLMCININWFNYREDRVMTSCTLPGPSGRGDQLSGRSTPQVWGAGTNKEKSSQGLPAIILYYHDYWFRDLSRLHMLLITYLYMYHYLHLWHSTQPAIFNSPLFQ